MFTLMKFSRFFVYIITNKSRTVLYTGMTNNLPRRLLEHYLKQGILTTFTGRYNCYNLLYYEVFPSALDAIHREKEIKGWTREKKKLLIETENLHWEFINNEIMEWPPKDDVIKREVF